MTFMCRVLDGKSAALNSDALHCVLVIDKSVCCHHDDTLDKKCSLLYMNNLYNSHCDEQITLTH